MHVLVPSSNNYKNTWNLKNKVDYFWESEYVETFLRYVLLKVTFNIQYVTPV